MMKNVNLSRVRSPFAEKVVEELDKLERSQAWLARRCDVTNATINRILNDSAIPSLSTLYQISKQLKLDFTELALLIVKEIGDEN
ncbi:MAG: helix-turn-helix domain-containing protein [Oscillospiraceae bacterium]|nr:helix-turn-helix domain-containing protein [Oscillospiraceae bacterium]